MSSLETDSPSPSPTRQECVNTRYDDQEEEDPVEPAQAVICGAGIVGLVLALALHEHVGIKAEVYEAAPKFAEDVGAAMGMYPNGLRVLRDIDPALCDAVRAAGCPYLFRRWERHDGTEVAVATENVLSKCNDSSISPSSLGLGLPVMDDTIVSSGDSSSRGSDDEEGDEFCSMGIMRWRFQRILQDAAMSRDIPIHFNKRSVSVDFINGDGGLESVSSDDIDQIVTVRFEDGTSRRTRLLFGADGSKSTVRRSVADPKSRLEYSGVTCLMGIASNVSRPPRGIYFPSSTTTKCHAVFFPTREDGEQCFQFHFPVPAEKADEGNWGTLSEKVGREECRKLANKLREDGWDEKYLRPLAEVKRAVRIGFCTLVPNLEHWVYGETNGNHDGENANNKRPDGNNRRRGHVVLLGDAAHPPLPYIGQGAQIGLEDAGVLALLLKNLCLDASGVFRMQNFSRAAKVYEKMRIPRASAMLDNSAFMGRMQQKRANNERHNEVKEELIRRQVFFHENLPVYFPGVQYDYREDVERVLATEASVVLPMLTEEQG